MKKKVLSVLVLLAVMCFGFATAASADLIDYPFSKKCEVQEDGSVYLEWKAPDKAVTEYVVMRGTSSTSIKKEVAKLTPDTTEYVDSSVAADKTYCYRIKAVAPKETYYTSVLKVKTPPVFSIYANYTEGKTIDINLGKCPEGVSEVKISRATSATGTYKELGTLNVSEGVFTDETISLYKNYYYKAEATDGTDTYTYTAIGYGQGTDKRNKNMKFYVAWPKGENHYETVKAGDGVGTDTYTLTLTVKYKGKATSKYTYSYNKDALTVTKLKNGKLKVTQKTGKEGNYVILVKKGTSKGTFRFKFG